MRNPILFTWLLATSLSVAAEPAPDFERDVAPVLIRRCLECHNERDATSGLVLALRGTALSGGDGGAVIHPGRPDDSSLVQRVESGEMPPPRRGRSQRLPAAEARVLRAWVAAGAPWPETRRLDLFERTTDLRAGRDWWSLQSVVRPPLPSPRGSATVATEPDAFIAARLAAANLEPAPPADRRVLIRRLYADLLGLPPTAEAIEAFVADETPDAYEQLVDRLLASPHFGERAARPWLDLVRFAETSGYERDQVKPHAWRYRDWVVRSINEDRPFDRFLLEQLAGDELPDRTEDSVIATGFLRLGTWNDEPNDPQEYKYERLEDLVHATSTAFLGYTVKCARCHDHKFDPIPQADYYRVAAAFWAGPIEARDRAWVGGPTAGELGFDVLGWTDLGREPPPLKLLKKGDPRQPRDEVRAGTLSIVPALDRTFGPAPSGRTTQRRLQLAQWLVDPRHPLTARVFVNRLWQQHFGLGLVRTSNDFGFNGDRPTHPELLDWLASELVQNGWRAKPIHRRIVLSRTYRQASLHPRAAEFAQRDAGNRLWWRAERRRLDADGLRDAALAVSGRLDTRLGGPSFKPTIEPDALEGLSRKGAAWQASPPNEQRRRSLYTFLQRSLLPPLLTTFDAPDTTLPCGQRESTTVAPQALSLLNGRFLHEQSEAVAGRVVTGGTDAADSVRSAWRLVLSRDPSADELAASLRHVDRQQAQFRADGLTPADAESRAWASLSHVLLNTNEFAYVD